MAHILVVDDDEQILRLLTRMLKTRGHSVETATDGEEGITAYRAGTFDLMLLDLLMPNKEGLETIVELRAEFPDIKIIAMSGGSEAYAFNDLPTATKLGAQWRLCKPFDRAKLDDVVSQALAATEN
jgi:CheY-like chemotaxis protein